MVSKIHFVAHGSFLSVASFSFVFVLVFSCGYHPPHYLAPSTSATRILSIWMAATRLTALFLDFTKHDSLALLRIDRYSRATARLHCLLHLILELLLSTVFCNPLTLTQYSSSSSTFQNTRCELSVPVAVPCVSLCGCANHNLAVSSWASGDRRRRPRGDVIPVTAWNISRPIRQSLT